MYRILLLSLSLLILFSCSDDISKDTISNFASVYTSADGKAEYFTLDDNQTLYVVKSETDYNPVNPRVYIQYKKLEDDYAGFSSAIQLVGYIYDIPTKELTYVSESNQLAQDSIGYNAVDLVSAVAKGDFITLRFKYKMSGDKKQLFSLLEDYSTIDASKPIALTFRHNILNDKEDYMSTDNYICFNIKKYLSFQNQLVFKIAWVDYDGNIQYLLVPYRK